VAQIDQQSATLIDRIGDQDTSINDLAKTVARGVPAMRDASENVLELNPGATFPLLTSRPNDVGQAYVDGTIQVVDRTGQEWRDLAAGTITGGGGATELNSGGIDTKALTVRSYLDVASTVYATSSQVYDAYAERVHCGNAIMNSGGFGIGNSWMNNDGHWGPNGSFGGVVINGGGINVGGRGVWNGGTIDGALHYSGGAYFNGGGFTGPAASLGGVVINGGGIDTYGRNVWAYNLYCAGISAWSGGSFFNLAYAFLVPYSDRRMKHDIVDVDQAEAFDHFLALRPREFEWNDHPEQGRVRGFVADEMPERFQRQAGLDDDDEPLGGYDLGEVVTTTVGAVQALSAKLDAATEKITALTARLDAALDRVAALEAAA